MITAAGLISLRKRLEEFMNINQFSKSEYSFVSKKLEEIMNKNQISKSEYSVLKKRLEEFMKNNQISKSEYSVYTKMVEEFMNKNLISKSEYSVARKRLEEFMIKSEYSVVSKELSSLNQIYISNKPTSTGAPTTGNHCTRMSSIYLNNFPSFSLCSNYFLCPS